MNAAAFVSQQPETTLLLGEAVGRCLQAGDCLALDGQLGSGKTTFAQGVARGLEVAEAVTSPTYLLCIEHPGRVPLLHLDAYFTARMEAVLAEGLVERFHGCALVVEWASHVAEWLPADRLQVHLEDGGPRQRTVRFQARGPRSSRLLAEARPGLEQAAGAAPAGDGGGGPSPPRRPLEKT